MYTEDDKKVNVKKDNSNNEFDDFYTSFDQLEDKDNNGNKKGKTSSKKVKSKKEKEEADFDDFYGTNDETNEEENNDKNDKSKIIKICLIALGVIALVVLIIFLISKTGKPKGDIELTNENISLKVGETDYISYKIINTDSEVISTFTSSSDEIVIVDENGQVTGISGGEATITISYTIDGKQNEKKCTVTVTDDENVNKELVLNLTFTSGSNNKWTNKNAVIKVEAKSAFGIENIKYAINCDDNCNYEDIGNNSSITISNEGTTRVKVIARDKSGQETTKEVTAKIDKEPPVIEFDNQDITSSKDVQVCATCSDNISGCKQAKVCKKYTSSKSNETITVTDNAGNKRSSGTFNVTIKKVQAPCSLTVSPDGIVTATLREAADNYGFDQTFSGSNELSKKINISATKAGESKASRVFYYVKDKNGNVGSCYLIVVKECVCEDANSKDANCKAKCSFRAN